MINFVSFCRWLPAHKSELSQLLQYNRCMHTHLFHPINFVSVEYVTLVICSVTHEIRGSYRSTDYQRLYSDFLPESLIFACQQVHHKINKSQCQRKATISEVPKSTWYRYLFLIWVSKDSNLMLRSCLYYICYIWNLVTIYIIDLEKKMFMNYRCQTKHDNGCRNESLLWP